jgi:hypothetical protein
MRMRLIVALIVAYAFLVLVSPVHTDDPDPTSVFISPWGGRCLIIASIVGALVLASFAIALRRHVLPVATFTLLGFAAIPRALHL